MDAHFAPDDKEEEKDFAPLDAVDVQILQSYAVGAYSKEIRQAEKDIKALARKITDTVGVKESDTGLAPPSYWDLDHDRQVSQSEQPLQVRCGARAAAHRRTLTRSPAGRAVQQDHRARRRRGRAGRGAGAGRVRGAGFAFGCENGTDGRNERTNERTMAQNGRGAGGAAAPGGPGRGAALHDLHPPDGQVPRGAEREGGAGRHRGGHARRRGPVEIRDQCAAAAAGRRQGVADAGRGEARRDVRGGVLRRARGPD